MKIEIYHGFPDASKMIRQKVFVEEQGFQNEFDEIDSFATHFVLYDENHSALGTCRVFWDEAMNSYLLGRLALVKEAEEKSLDLLSLVKLWSLSANREVIKLCCMLNAGLALFILG